MGIQEVKGNSQIPEYQERKKAKHAEGFQESLMQNLKCQEQGREDVSVKGKSAKKTGKQDGVGMIGGRSGVRVNSVELTAALQTAEVRHMSYEESDNIAIAVAEGYTLKGKIQPADAQVYVEAKYDDGRLEAYQVDTSVIPEKTGHLIEKFALETLGSVERD